jgi:hypothetical protein
MKFLGRGLQVLALILLVGIFASSAVAVRVGTGSSYGSDQSTVVTFSGPDFNEQEVSVTGGNLFLFQINTSIDDFTLMLSSIDQFNDWGILAQEPVNCLDSHGDSVPNCPFPSSSSTGPAPYYTGLTNPCVGGTGVSANPATGSPTSVTFTASGVGTCTSADPGSLTLFLFDSTSVTDPNTGAITYPAAPVDACLTAGTSTSCNMPATTTPEPSSLTLLLAGAVGFFLIFHLAQRKTNYQAAAI